MSAADLTCWTRLLARTTGRTGPDRCRRPHTSRSCPTHFCKWKSICHST